MKQEVKKIIISRQHTNHIQEIYNCTGNSIVYELHRIQLLRRSNPDMIATEVLIKS